MDSLAARTDHAQRDLPGRHAFCQIETFQIHFLRFGGTPEVRVVRHLLHTVEVLEGTFLLGLGFWDVAQS